MSPAIVVPVFHAFGRVMPLPSSIELRLTRSKSKPPPFVPAILNERSLAVQRVNANVRLACFDLFGRTLLSVYENSTKCAKAVTLTSCTRSRESRQASPQGIDGSLRSFIHDIIMLG